MKKLIVLSLGFILLTGAAWVDLEKDQLITVTEKIDVDGDDGAPYVIPVGTQIRLYDKMPLVLDAWLYTFTRESCHDQGRTVDLILTEHSTEGYEYGVNVEEDCTLNIFLVEEDLYSPSIAD